MGITKFTKEIINRFFYFISIMKKFAFIIAFMLVMSLFVSSCGMTRSDAWRLAGVAAGTAAYLSNN